MELTWIYIYVQVDTYIYDNKTLIYMKILTNSLLMLDFPHLIDRSSVRVMLHVFQFLFGLFSVYIWLCINI